MGRWTHTHTQCVNKILRQNVHISLFDVTGQVVGGGLHVTFDKPSTLKPVWTKNTWTDLIGVRMSQGRNVTADGLLGRQIVWVEL
jgi:hypothetical protein